MKKVGGGQKGVDLSAVDICRFGATFERFFE